MTSRRDALYLVAIALAFLAGLIVGPSARGATSPPAPEPSWLPVLPETPQPSGGMGPTSEPVEPVMPFAAESVSGGASPSSSPVAPSVEPNDAPASPGGLGARASTAPERTPKPGGTWSRAVASWYGADFYNRRTACGQTYTASLWGVAHKSLPCGRLVDISFGGRFAYRVPVIDRGPYIAGRTWDLSNAVAGALGFRATGVGTVGWRYSG